MGGGKVYWTEKTGASGGTITGANLDGTQFKTLATILAAPMGIAVDTAGSRLYWTNSRGRVQRANLDGSTIQNVVDGLGTPSTLVIGGASQGTTAAKPATQPAQQDNSAYDVNGDGTVDNVDASLVSGAMGTTTAKYDVNGDGSVNFLDLLLIFDNRDEGAAGAPTIVGMQLSSVQIAVIEEQIDLLIATGGSLSCSDADVDLSAAAHSNGTSRENAVACELSEPVQPRDVDPLRTRNRYRCGASQSTTPKAL